VSASFLVGCQPSDPREKVLKQRSRWDVQLLSWIQGDDGSIRMTTRLSGPPSSSIADLTVRIDLLDATEQTVKQVWHTFDLAPIARGGPKDVTVLLAAEGLAIEGIGIHRVLEPGPDDEPHIRELQP
jgi:hypothetical protein